MHLGPRYVGGASTVEAMILLPLVIWLALAGLQLIWLFWAQQTLHTTGHYVLRAGQVQHGSQNSMHNVLATGMASIALQWHEQPRADDDRSAVKAGALRATTLALVHSRIAAKITVHSPQPIERESYSEHRYDLRSATWLTEIAVDHARARVSELTSEQQLAWLNARQLEIEIWWCLPLEVPLVAPVLQAGWHWLDNPAQRFCRSREQLVGKPLWPLVTRRKGPMQSSYREND